VGEVGVKWEEMENTATEPFYGGTFRHRLDEKNRVTVPAKWRFSGDENDAYLAWPHPQGHIVLYPPSKIKELREVLKKVPESDPNGQAILRKLFGAAHQLGPDASGRLKLPEELLKEAKIEKEIILIGLGDRINILSAHQYEKEKAQKVDLMELMKGIGL
jgi:MraZ protein